MRLNALTHQIQVALQPVVAKPDARRTWRLLASFSGHELNPLDLVAETSQGLTLSVFVGLNHASEREEGRSHDGHRKAFHLELHVNQRYFLKLARAVDNEKATSTVKIRTMYAGLNPPNGQARYMVKPATQDQVVARLAL